MIHQAKIADYTCGRDSRLLWIAGPCVLETKEISYEIADKLVQIANKYNLQLVFKGSFDKANRTSFKSARGPGLLKGLQILRDVKEEFGIPVTTDIHEAYQAKIVRPICDLIQIPAFLCRQTDLLAAAAWTEKAVHIKKGQFLSPQDMFYAVNKIHEIGNKNVILGERGASFGYNRLVSDMTAIPIMQQYAPVIFDATHSVQQPGGGETSGGNRDMVPYLAKAATAVGCDGIFFETHPDPNKSPSDGPNMIKLADAEFFIERILRIKAAL